MKAKHFDLITLGAGSGGVRASRLAANLGFKVGVVESKQLGGTCVNLGCIPKKLMSYASHFSDDFRDAESYGWDVQVNQFSWSRLLENKNREIRRLNSVYGGLLEKANVHLIRGFGQLVATDTVEVGSERWTADKILIATGSRPRPWAVEGAELADTSDEAFHWPELPKRVAIVGGGYIACEFASILSGLGAEVHLVYRGGQLLRGFDHEIREHLTGVLQQRGISIHLNETVRSIRPEGDGLRVELESETGLDCEKVLQAIGRIPNTHQLGLSDIGVEMGADGTLAVDANFQTNVDGIYALGDVLNRANLTPVAIEQAIAFVKTHFEQKPTVFSYEHIPTAVFTNPAVACVGMSEEEARLKFPAVRSYHSQFRPLRSTLVAGASEKVLMKLVVDGDSDRVLGCHMVGEDAPEIIQGFAVALKCGATKSQLDATVGIHPSAAEEFVTMR